MKILVVLSYLILMFIPVKGQSLNNALKLDGKDNKPSIGMGIIQNQWTLEAWVKKGDRPWKAQEAIIGIGEYAKLDRVDQLPLMLKWGRLYNAKADIISSETLDHNWHHIAISCDGIYTKLYIDGRVVASKKSVSDILPGEIGTSDIDSTGFEGYIDEVRIWESAVSANTLREWMGQPLSSRHPNFVNLKGYYNFDQLENNTILNWMGKGNQSYHLRNTRKNYKGSLPLAYLVKNENPLFKTAKKQKLFNGVVIQSEWDVDQNVKNDQLLKLRIATNGSKNEMELTSVNLDFSKTTLLSDIEQIHLYYVGQTPRSSTKIALFGKGKIAGKNVEFTEVKGKAFKLKAGVNYFLVTVDVNKNSKIGNIIRANVTSFGLNNTLHVPDEDQTQNIFKLITPNSTANPNILKLLQWNIWHGGVHLGQTEGPQRVKDLIKNTGADIIAIQEGYGAQTELANALGYEMHTKSPSDNLALLSRYAITKSISNDYFKSNTGIISLPNKRKVLIGNWWLRYASKHEYTGSYADLGLDTKNWIDEDSKVGAIDAQRNLDKDIDPIIQSNPELPVIIAGDFNSGTHLDWTSRAAFLHYGYGPVDFPISKLMVNQGYTDAHRHLYPDEVVYPTGTFAAIYGHMQTLRIDFIYYKGLNIKPLFSKIVRTAPEIDDVWPSDHAAVFTVFEVK